MLEIRFRINKKNVNQSFFIFGPLMYNMVIYLLI